MNRKKDSGMEPIPVIEESGTGTAEQPDVTDRTQSEASGSPLGQLAAAAMLGGIIAGLYVFAQVDALDRTRKRPMKSTSTIAANRFTCSKETSCPSRSVVSYQESPAQAAWRWTEGCRSRQSF